MINLSLKKLTKDSKAIFVQYGDYLGKNKRTNTTFQVIRGITKDELQVELEQGIRRLLAEKMAIEQKEGNEKKQV